MNLNTSFFNRRPALRLAVLVSAGILLAQSISFDSGLILAVAIILFLSSALLFRFSKRGPSLDILLMLLVVSIGVVLHSFQRQELVERKIIPDEENEQVALEGFVDDEPFVKGEHVQLVVQTDRIVRLGRSMQAERRILVRGKTRAFHASLNELLVGAFVRVRGVIEEYPQPRNPGGFDYGRYLELNDIHGIVQVKESSAVQIVDSLRESSFFSSVSRVKKVLLRIFDRLHGEQEANFLRGVILGDRSKIPDDIKKAFVDTGTIHILAVSGSNVAVVAIVLYAVLSLLRLSRKWIVVPTILGFLAYMLLTDSQASVVRATVMAIVLVVQPLFERKVDIYQSLSVSALVLLLWNSNNLFDVGFQLSFAAVFSIVYLYPIFVKLIHKIPERFEEIRLLNPALKLLAVSLAAQLGTLPFTAYYFERVSVVSLVANLVVVPLVGINTLLGFATMFFAFVSAPIAQCYATLNGTIVSFVLGFVKTAASVPYAYIDASHVEASFPILYYIGLIGFANIDKPRVRKAALIAGLIGLNVFVYSPLLQRQEKKLEVTMIDVGQGDAILLEFPHGKRILVDAGPKSFNYDAGERLVAPVLRFKGIEKLEAVIMSHPHNDHIGGVLYILEHFNVGRLIEPALQGETALYRQIRTSAAAHAVGVQPYSAGDTIQVDNAARLYVLHPIAAVDSTNNLNNASIVVKLVYGSTELLLTGDAEQEVEKKMLRRYAAFLQSDLLKAAHHGSNTSSSQDFVKTVQPEMTIVSVGKNNKFRHPSPSVMNLFVAEGIRILRTDKVGAIVVESDGKEWRVVPWR